MRFLILFLLFSSFVHAQTLNKAVFKECVENSDPLGCTEEKFENSINDLVTYAITDSIKKVLKERYFSVSVIFVTDENGAVISKDTDIRCEFPELKKAIENYINSLPLLSPKNTENSINKRFLHTLYYTFMFDYVIKKYYIISKERLSIEKIKPNYYTLDTPILFPGCRYKKKEKGVAISKRSQKKFLNFINENFNIPPSDGNPRKVKIYTNISIEKNGTVKVLDIICSDEVLSQEMRNVIAKLPKFEPATLKGFPIRATFYFPTTVNIVE